MSARDAVADLIELPAHYKYVAVLNPGHYKLRDLYSESGLGRVGVIFFDEGEHKQLVARIEVAPERFRVGPEVIRQIDRFTAREHADMEIRV